MTNENPGMTPEELLEFMKEGTRFLDNIKAQADTKANTAGDPNRGRAILFATDLEGPNAEAHRAVTEMDKLVKQMTEEMEAEDDGL